MQHLSCEVVFIVGQMVAPEMFWVGLRAGVAVAAASAAVGVSQWTGYRWLAEAGGPAVVGVPWSGRGRPWGGRAGADVRGRFWSELRRGSTIAAAARAAGVARRTGHVWLNEAGGVRPRVVNRELEAGVVAGAGVLSFVDRCRIEELVGVGYCPARIAGLLGRSRSTITREIARGRVEGRRYRAQTAQNRVEANRRRAGRPAKLVAGSHLFAAVVEGLTRRRSPAQIAGRLRRDFPDDPEMWVSHETIYQALYVRPRGELARQVTEALRTGRTLRKPQGRHPHPKFKAMVNISERPAEAEDRAVPGHWESQCSCQAA